MKKTYICKKIERELMLKRILSCLVLCLLFLTVGCGELSPPVHGKPVRIVAMNLDADEVVLDLVEPERICALTELVDNPGVSYYTDKAKSVPGRIRTYTVEEIISLHPDLVIVSDWMDASLQKTLEDTGIVVHRYREAKTLAEIPAVVRGIAKAVGEESRGEALVHEFLTTSEQLIQKTRREHPQGPSVFLWAHQSPYGTHDTLFADMCRQLGVHNVLDRFTGKNARAVTQEFIIQTDPELILLTNWHFQDEPLAKLQTVFTENPAFSSLQAVRHHRFALVPGRALFCPNHLAANGLAEVAEAIYGGQNQKQ